jgi:hypothetical protein
LYRRASVDAWPAVGTAKRFPVLRDRATCRPARATFHYAQSPPLRVVGTTIPLPGNLQRRSWAFLSIFRNGCRPPIDERQDSTIDVTSTARLCVGSDPGRGNVAFLGAPIGGLLCGLWVQRSLSKQVGILVNVFLPHLLHHGFDLIRSVIRWNPKRLRHGCKVSARKRLDCSGS